MKKAKKRIIIVTAMAILAVSLIPIPRYLKDGGTVEYNALLYSVHQVHSLNLDGGYNVGTKVRVLFWTVFDNVQAV